MSFAAVVSVDNSGEDPDEGRRSLREELTPVIRELPGFVSCIFLTDYERRRGLGVVLLETREQATQLAAGLVVGAEIRVGATVIASEVFEVAASA